MHKNTFLTINTLLKHAVVLSLVGSLTFCAPAVQDFRRSHKDIDGNDTAQDAFSTYNQERCDALGLILLPNGQCDVEETSYDQSPNHDCDDPESLTQEQVMACNEHQGVQEKNGGGFWTALLAVVAKEVIGVLGDLKNENLHNQWVKSYVKKQLDVKVNGQSIDVESSLEAGTLVNHRLFLKKHPTKQGQSSLQFELKAKDNHIATFGGQRYGKRMLMCLNTAYATNSSKDTSNTDHKVALQMKSRFNSLKEPFAHISKQGVLDLCNTAGQEQSYIAFQVNSDDTYHVFVLNPKEMGFSKPWLNNNDEGKYTVNVDGKTKDMPYYLANNIIDFGLNGDHIVNLHFTDDQYGMNNDASAPTVLKNAFPGSSAYETSGINNFQHKQEFFEKFLHIQNGDDSNARKFCNGSSVPEVGCFD